MGGLAQGADFVEEESAAIGPLETAGAGLAGAAEAAFFDADLFGLDELPRNGGAVDGDEGLFGAVADVVQGARELFLADAAFAEEEHRRPGWCDALDHVADGIEARGDADQIDLVADLGRAVIAAREREFLVARPQPSCAR